jgi:hypothetical protein
MVQRPYRVARVVDPTFGARLGKLAERMRVWALRSPVNEEVARRVWKASNGTNALHAGVTLSAQLATTPKKHMPTSSGSSTSTTGRSVATRLSA